jgi:signal transduction histidine kinase/CheY-like chemotaxis protein
MLDFGQMFDASPNPYMVVDRELRYVAVNRAYCEATHRTAAELVGSRVTDEFPHDPEAPGNAQARRLVDSLRGVFVTGKPDVLPLIHYRIEIAGRYEDIYWSATHTPLLGPDGQVTHVLQHTVNVTELERSRSTSLQIEAGILDRAQAGEARSAALDKNLRELVSVFDQAPGFLAVTRGPDHVFELVNPEYRKLVGGRDVVGKPVREALPELEPHFFELLDGVFARGEPFVGSSLPATLANAAGEKTEVFVDFVYQPLTGADGKPSGILVSGHDVTARVHAERAREHAQAELEAIFDGFPEALYIADQRGIRRANARAAEILGYESIADMLRPRQEVIEHTQARSADTGEPLVEGASPMAEALRGRAVRREIVVKHLGTGEDVHLFASGAPIRGGGAVVAAVDITERKRVEMHALQLARVLGETRDFVGIANLEGTPTFANEAALRLLGFPDLATALNIHFIDCFVPRQRAQVRDEVVPAAMETGYWQGELAFCHYQTHEEIPVWYSIFPLRDAAGVINGLATITRDLRPQKLADAERAALLEAERAARAQAERATLLMDQFLATVSHELRTPLSAILGWTQLLRSGSLSPEKRERALATVERNAQAQAHLVEDLLDVSRIVSGKLTIEMEQTDLAAAVAAAVETVRPAAQAKGVLLDVDLDEADTTVRGDSARLQQVVWNLLANAVKFTPAEGRVALRVSRQGDMVEVRVSDSGIGISRDFLAHVFDRFRQADAGSARRRGGLGLGLAIVHHVVEAHGGTVRADSAGVDQGSTFTVRIPRAKARVVPALELGGASPVSLQGMKILVVDDEEDTREFVRSLLEQNAAEVTVAASAADAMVSLQRELPDLLLSDIGMPGEDGYSFIRRVRALPAERGGRTPAVALTAYARSEDRARAMLSGFQNHVAKPVVATELLAVLACLRS